MNHDFDFNYLAVTAQPKQQWQQLFANNNAFSHWQLRDRYVKKLGFPIITQELVQELAVICKGKRVLDVGAGSGFISYNLQQHGVQVTPVDALTSHQFELIAEVAPQLPYVIGDALALVPDYDIILMSWPPYDDPFAFNVSQAMTNQQLLLYLGEGAGGCTANDQFHWVLDKCTIDHQLSQKLNAQHLTWYGVHDYWVVAKLN